jgi:hypothetical protein
VLRHPTDGYVKFEETPQITIGPVSCKIKINIITLPSMMANESQNKGDIEMLTIDQSTDNGHGQVLAETSREYGEGGKDEECVDLSTIDH